MFPFCGQVLLPSFSNYSQGKDNRIVELKSLWLLQNHNK